jgi:glycerol-3-phosphate cytidylyltransferase
VITIGLTFGVWDLLHIGHTRLLQRAREQCSYLIVGVSTDEYVLEHKRRLPIIPYEQRAELLHSIRHVSQVIPQSLTFGKAEAVHAFRPDVLFVGDDWTPETYSGANLGVPVTYLPRTRETSTTSIIEGIQRVRAQPASAMA